MACRRRKSTVGEHAPLPNDLRHLSQVFGVQRKVLEEPSHCIIVVYAACGEVSYQAVVTQTPGKI